MSNPTEGPRIGIYRCPAHPDFWSVCIDLPSGIGTRVLGGKCCPNQYKLVRSWPLTQEKRDSFVEEMDAALEAD